jgi:hypothetical protein
MFLKSSKKKTILTENSYFHFLLQTENVNGKNVVYLLQTEIKNGSLFSLVGKRSTVINDCCFSKCAPSWLYSDMDK